jgi:peptidoglycan/xylan/chitin deacetylase (PgdA/CDA1 family)
MLRNNFKKVVTCTSTLVLFSFHSDKTVTAPLNSPLAGKIVSRNANNHRPHHRSSGEPYTIYLTFDDGPSSGSRMVNELSQRDSLQINVFLIGRNVCLTEKNRALFKDYQDNPLIELGNHSYTHAQRHYEKYFDNPSEVLADFNRNRDSLRLENNFARLPGRNFFRIDTLSRNDISTGTEAADTLATKGYKVFGWDLEWRRQPTKGFALHTGKEMLEIVEKMLDTKKTFIPGNLILLLHDTELRDEHFMGELEDFIRRAKADGKYSFEHLSVYPN